jgi:hypothetical protein
MTQFPARRFALGALAATVLGTVTTVAPAVAASPSYPVTCASAAVDAARGVTTTFTLSCVDADEDPIDEYVVVSQPTKAQTFSVDAATGQVTYRSTAAAHGTDSFTFKGVIDGLGESTVTTAVITLENKRPTCAPVAALGVVHDRAVTVPVTCSDADGDALTVATGTTGAAHGAVTIAGGQVTYKPAPGFVGADTFTLRSSDGFLLSDEVAVAVTVTNAAPTLKPAAKSVVKPGKKVRLKLVTADADKDALTVAVAGAPKRGEVVRKGAKWFYVADKGSRGKDVFTLTVTDGIATSKPVRFVVAVKPARKR